MTWTDGSTELLGDGNLVLSTPTEDWALFDRPATASKPRQRRLLRLEQVRSLTVVITEKEVRQA